MSQPFDFPRIGVLPGGPLDSLADVAGVTVGHHTLAAGAVQTGVTVIRPHDGDLFLNKLPAGLAVLNGFGKSMGLLQMQELGQLETAIVLGSTMAVGTLATALTREAIARHPQIGRDWPTVNPLVLECNDGYLNDAQAFAVQASDMTLALASTDADFAQGSVGAGRGMSAFGLKGGIGSASRQVEGYLVAALVLANFGRPEALTIRGRCIGPLLQQRLRDADKTAGPEKGSIILILATDAPLDARQLSRLARRAGAGLARTGSDYGHGSGDIALAFSTAYKLPHSARVPMPAIAMLHEARLDPLFQAGAEACEQAIVKALFAASTVEGRDGRRRVGLSELAPDWRELLS
ncbi:DmpA family aminopeptidase [Roseateles oligotrophus]|uniref:P1 family peptidase n=1 Tax=Roseateles oligotrophus TaxID=1769250 RepID=A0ABT2YGT6_9BURK|nr:P1 family peptidase [Roseateles oligotrophus]MCV2369263.1 P1 family peptidase [Roseateles oligotrophus]